MPITVIEGEQRGDEGKGRFVDMLIPDYDIGTRFNGGDNAGHTVVSPEGEVYKLHGLPTSVIYPDKKSVIGNGTVINPTRLTKEIENLNRQNTSVDPCNLLISSAAHLIMPHHIIEDHLREAGEGKQGSTKSGIAQAYAAKYNRTGLRAESINNDRDQLLHLAARGIKQQIKNKHAIEKQIGEEISLGNIDTQDVIYEFAEAVDQLGKFVTDTSLFLNRELKSGKSILAEGAQAFLLDIDHGMYPYVTSSSTTAGGVGPGLGVPCRAIDRVIGVSKAIQSHVGGGPFVTEITHPETLERLHGDMTKVDAEMGTTTGRIRRLGHLDLAQIKRSQMINGTDEMAVTKLDWVSRYEDEIPICVAYTRKGKRLDIAPDAAYKLVESTPIYEFLPGWKEDIQGVKEFKDLPKNAQKYIEFIEFITGLHVTMIGVGPGRDQVIVR
jgi:adenylosuccinate synthase